MRNLRLVILLCLAIVVAAIPAFADLIRVHGTVVSVTAEQTFLFGTDDGRTVPVDFSRDDIDPRWLTPGEGVTVVGTVRHGRVVARDVIEEDPRHHQRVHGAIRSVGPGRSLVLTTDDGGTLRVDLRHDDIDMRRLTPGEGIVVVGVPGRRPGIFIARDVIEDAARHRQRVHGVILSVGPGRSLVLATDDGRTLRVDLSRDDIDMRLLTRGEGIIVVGRPGHWPGVFIARNVVQDETRQAQRVRGAILMVGPGRRLMLAADDGRTLHVDLSPDDTDVRLLRRGDRILVVGVTGVEPGVFTARNVVLDDHPSASPRYPYER